MPTPWDAPGDAESVKEANCLFLGAGTTIKLAFKPNKGQK